MPSQHLANRRVLVVENDYFLATELSDTLQRAGARVIGPVGKVRDGLAALSQSPEVAVLDMRLGDDTSFPIADELARRGVPFVFATGTGGDIPPPHQGRPVFTKPISDFIIIKALANALGKAA